MLGLLSLAAASLISTAGIAPVSQIDYPKTPIVEFVTDNFGTFVSEYNRYHEDSLTASRVVRTRSLALNDDQTGYYFDFDKGFMVATDDYDIFFISNYDPTYENELFLTDGDIYFSGTAFFDQDGTEFGLDDSDFIAGLPQGLEDSADLSNAETVPDGNIRISDVYSYILDNYSGYDIVDEYYIPSYDYINQFQTSVYAKVTDGGMVSSEGNCILTATYSMLHNMGKNNRDRNFYFKDYGVNYVSAAENGDPHSYLLSEGWEVNASTESEGPYKGVRTLEHIPDLYLRLRSRAISSYGYDEEDGMKLAKVKNMIEDVEEYYGYGTTFTKTGNFKTMKALVDDNIPVVVGVTNSPTYGNHAMSVNGYIELQKETGWWIFKSTSTKWILSVDDGWHSGDEEGDNHQRFYDPSRKGGATFVCADEDSIDFSTC